MSLRNRLAKLEALERAIPPQPAASPVPAIFYANVLVCPASPLAAGWHRTEHGEYQLIVRRVAEIPKDVRGARLHDLPDPRLQTVTGILTHQDAGRFPRMP